MASAVSPTTSPRSETRLPTKDTGRLARVANQECLSRSEIQGGWKINVIMSGFGKSDYFAFGYIFRRILQCHGHGGLYFLLS